MAPRRVSRGTPPGWLTGRGRLYMGRWVMGGITSHGRGSVFIAGAERGTKGDGAIGCAATGVCAPQGCAAAAKTPETLVARLW